MNDRQGADFPSLIAAIENSDIVTPELATEALGLVRDGIITGEGPTTQGRVHFSRTLDADDAAWCARILLAAGKAGAPVSRAEAELLFDINAAGAERADNGRFDDLFVKAIAHHVLDAAGHPVPPRATALSPSVALHDWAKPQSANIDAEILAWIASHVRKGTRHSRTLMSLVAALAGLASAPFALSIASMVDFLA